MQSIRKKATRSINITYWLIVCVVIITMFSHGVNFAGYPKFLGDEGIYTSQAWGLISRSKIGGFYTYWYDHSPFGWIQIGLWQLLTGGPFTFGLSVYSARLFMVIVAIFTNVVLFLVLKTLTKSLKLSFLASVIFTFSPLMIFFQRQVLLDNLATFWFLLSLFFLLNTKSRLFYFWLSGITYGAAFLSKEVTIVFLPVILYLVWEQSKGENRQFCRLIWFTSALFLIFLFPLLAILKREFLPSGWFSQFGAERVSFLETVIFQLTRGSNFSVWQSGSYFRVAFAEWVGLDPIIFLSGIITTITNLFLYRKKHDFFVFPLLSLSFFLFLARGGLVLHFYIIPMLPLLVINLILFLKAIAEEFPKIAKIFQSKITFIICTVLIIEFLISQNFEIYARDATSNQLTSVEYIKKNIANNAVIVMDDFALLDLRLNSQIVPKNFPNTESFTKVDNDPSVRFNKLNDKWENIDYILTNGYMLMEINAGRLPLLKEAFDHAIMIKDFPTDFAIKLWAKQASGIADESPLTLFEVRNSKRTINLR